MTADALASRVVELARARGVRIAVAESLTGGLLAATIVSVPGASRVFSGGVVVYDTALKHRLLGVDGTLLAEQGPVHPRVAREMARGVRAACAVPRGDATDAAAGGTTAVAAAGEDVPADFGLATTGVAGPDPDPQTGQAAGTVWLGISSGAGDRAERLRLSGGRAEIREASVRAALQLLLAELEATGREPGGARAVEFPQS